MKRLSYLFALVAIMFMSLSRGYAAFPIQAQNSTLDTLTMQEMPAAATNIKANPSPRTTHKERNARSESAGFGIAALILGITGLVILGIVCGILAIVFGIIGMKRRLKGLAIAGLTLGIIDVVGVLLFLASM
jgi:uncharacterized membrane protein YkgB